MEILTGERLVNLLRSLCDKVEEKLWIASPFIGDWTAVRKILGRKWFDYENVGVRLLTDISNNGGLNPKTIRSFRDRGEIKDLRGLHAKVYIVDNYAILTSANLTGVAFSKRCEVGVLLGEAETRSLVNLYNTLWEKEAKDVPSDWIPRVSSRRKKGTEETHTQKLPVRCLLPPDPGDPARELIPEFRDYESFLQKYREFSKTYEMIQQPRVWPDAPLYFETDSFLNFLFHEARGTPSYKYMKRKPRRLSKDQIEKEIRKYAHQFKNWISKGGDDRRRERSSETIRNLLSDKSILRIDRDCIKQVVDQLNCMKSMPPVKSKFLNLRNNDTETIRKAWRDLLYGRAPLQVKMTECKKTLQSFGRSSIHELLGFFSPDKYPIRNRNSSAGLRFFGYKVSVY